MQARRRTGRGAGSVERAAALVLLLVALSLAYPVIQALPSGPPLLDDRGQPTGLTERPVPLPALPFVTVLVVAMDSAHGSGSTPKGNTAFRAVPLARLRGRIGSLTLIGLDRRLPQANLLTIPPELPLDPDDPTGAPVRDYLERHTLFELKRQIENLLGVPVYRYLVLGPTASFNPSGEAGPSPKAAVTEALAAALAGPDRAKTNLSPDDARTLLGEWRDVDAGAARWMSLPIPPPTAGGRPEPGGTAGTVESFWPSQTQPVPGLDLAAPTRSAPGTPAAGPSLLGPAPFLVSSLGALAGLADEPARPVLYCPLLAGPAWTQVAPAGGNAVSVLVYHTHTTESFMPELYPSPEARIGRVADEDAFTEDLSLSVARVGEELAAQLDLLGLPTTHLVRIHDPGGQRGRSGAYARSRVTALTAAARLRRPLVILDVHRDAVTRTAHLPDGRPAAAVLLVVARQNPWWQWNYTFARNLDSRLAALAPGLSRGVRILDGRYNQDLSPAALIVEIGGADSTLAECLLTARLVAGVLADYLGGP